VTVGSDEGGHVPRAFGWRGERYRELHVPHSYTLRFEADWSPECYERLTPTLVPPNRVRLMRETISPASASGHGEHCDLPLDTLRVVGDSLALAH
jgi:hypothetical protein